jgi:uncharacterized membrane protein YphA (DoxX/SURF4 family)
MRREVIIEIICCAFILLFMYAAVTKLMDYEKFRVQIGQSPLLTEFAGLVVWGIPAAEILICIMLVIPRFRLIALYAAFSLMILFTAYIISILNFSEFVPCSCGGVLAQLGWTEHLIFTGVFALLALMGIILYSKKKVDNGQLAI